MAKEFDLSTLNLSAGTHEITVKARASGFEDSPASDPVSYVVAGEETYTVSGTWDFNYSLITSGYSFSVSVLFQSNGERFMRINVNSGYMRYMTFDEERGDWITVYSTTRISSTNLNPWQGYNAYRTITFDSVQTVSKEFYDWLVENAVRIDTVPIQAGTWRFNEILVQGNLSGIDIIPLNFIAWDGVDEVIAGSKAYSSIRHDTGEISFDNTWVCYLSEEWRNKLYRTIVVMENQTVTQKQYDWLAANATYIEGN